MNAPAACWIKPRGTRTRSETASRSEPPPAGGFWFCQKRLRFAADPAFPRRETSIARFKPAGAPCVPSPCRLEIADPAGWKLALRRFRHPTEGTSNPPCGRTMNGSRTADHGYRTTPAPRCASHRTSALFGPKLTFKGNSWPGRNAGMIRGSFHRLISEWPSAKVKPAARPW